ncbi:MAG: MBOAT family protein [Lewinellaceae bacterium]|nr:MBOAT family protein [Lewinellaceae bacterium]
MLSFYFCIVFHFDLVKIIHEIFRSPLVVQENGQYRTESPLIFSSGLFLFLFLGFYVVYWLSRRHDRWRIVWVTAFSLFFYYKCAGIFWLLHVLIVVVDYHLARWMEKAGSRERKIFLLVVSLVVNLGMLVYFKYNIYSELWCEILNKPFDPSLLFLPAGISFFTFQSLSYTIDVYRGQLKALNNMLDYAFFVTFFPQMVAGPIVRAADFLPQIHKPLFLTREDFGRGVFLICTGLFKKAVISDYISVNFVERIFDSPQQYTGLENLMGVYGYAMQIYCDFSGYSDMAIGFALLIGFKFPVNFDSPYQSMSITEFWRRWHISLSTWLRDYLYIPLGGNRKGRVRTYINLLITMLLGGLWHGAATRFLIWGALHGLALGMERWLRETIPGTPGGLRRALGAVWTFHFVCFCWIFFRADSMDIVYSMLSQIAFDFRPEIFPEFLTGYAPVVFWMSLGFGLHFLPKHWEDKAQYAVTVLPLVGKAALITLIVALVMQVKSSDVQPFIYFQF